jgi:hypothetical protein
MAANKIELAMIIHSITPPVLRARVSHATPSSGIDWPLYILALTQYLEAWSKAIAVIAVI